MIKPKIKGDIYFRIDPDKPLKRNSRKRISFNKKKNTARNANDYKTFFSGI